MNKTIENFTRNQIREGLEKCTEAQRNLFNRMYKNLDTMSADKLDWALSQVERTIIENEAKLAEGELNE